MACNETTASPQPELESSRNALKVTDNGLSKRGQHIHDYPNPMFSMGTDATKNPYDAVTNPQGVINMGIAENCLCEELWLSKLNEPELNQFQTYMQYYFDYKGDPSFKNGLAEFLTERLHSEKPLSPDNVIVTSGISSALDLLAMNFADPGDCFLTTSPYYGAIDGDVGTRSQVDMFSVPMKHKVVDGSPMWYYDIELLEEGWEDAKRQGKTVRVVIIINPHNPMGCIFPPELIQATLLFGQKHDIHVIMDEIYALSAFDEHAAFRSVLTLKSIPNRDKVHVLWGFSKDFGLSGLRCGVIYTWNEGLLSLAGSQLYLGAVPLVVQDKLNRVIRDKEWLDKKFFPTNLSRMREAHDRCCRRLKALEIPYVDSQAGFFVWADLTKFLPAGRVGRKEEMELFRKVFQAGVYIVPSQVFHARESGWFRITFTTQPELQDIGWSRLESVLRAQSATLTEVN